MFEDINDDLKQYGFTAADWFDVLCDALNEVFENTMENGNMINIDNFSEVIEFITADNCSTNCKLARDSGVPMVGCGSHRLNLAVQETLGTEERKDRHGIVTAPASYLQQVIRKLDLLMGELRTLKNAALLRTQTQLLPERRNKTRWASLMKLLLKWIKIKLFVAAINNFPPKLVALIPTAVENRNLEEYIDKLKDFESVSKEMQGGGTNRASLNDVKRMFAKLVEDYGDEFDLAQLKPDAAIVHSRHFENGIAKIQAKSETTLSIAEKHAVNFFLKPPPTTTTEEKEDEQQDLSYAQKIMRHGERQKKQRTSVSKYRSTRHVSSTSNIVERINSQAKLVLSDRRSSMSPDTLNMILILKANKSLWPNELTIQDILDNPTFAEPLPHDEEEEDELL